LRCTTWFTTARSPIAGVSRGISRCCDSFSGQFVSRVDPAHRRSTYMRNEYTNPFSFEGDPT
jgi:hypothetical protein